MSIFNLLENNKVRKEQNQHTLSTESLFQFTEIRGETIILKDGWLRSIIKVEGINLDLRSYEEQLQIIEQYKRFLNALDFPIQIIVHNSYLDLSDYINLMKEQVEKITNPTLASYGEEYISFMDAINTKEWLVYIKEFYIVVPYYSTEKDADHINKPRRQKFIDVLNSDQWAEVIIDRYRTYVKQRKFLEMRNNLIIEGMRWVWLQAVELDAGEIVSLLFKMYNPTLHAAQSSL